ncbi:MAG TPA: FHA domain-containing protein [Thermoanaerobaculia bacterium]|nr:FHA domain-containing protein [Thermoanaerobaculia bacterium]
MQIRFGQCVLDSETRQLHVGRETIHVKPKAFQFLELLIENRPRAVSKKEIHEKLWPGTFVSDGALTNLLVEVRTAIGDRARNPLFVRTVHRFGYAFCGEAEELRRPASAAARARSCWVLRSGKRTALEAGETIIGRDPGAGVFIDDPSVSRRHARIVVGDMSATIEDLGSKNGTHLGDRKVDATVALDDGARIRVGTVLLTFRMFSVPYSTQTAAEPSP